MCLSTKRADNNGGPPEFPFLIVRRGEAAYARHSAGLLGVQRNTRPR